jgi:hypothetical protein
LTASAAWPITVNGCMTLEARQPHAAFRWLARGVASRLHLRWRDHRAGPGRMPDFRRPDAAPRHPTYVAFDVLVAEGEDLRALPLVDRKAVLKHLAKGARHWIAVTDGVTGEGRRLFELVTEMDLEGIGAKRLADPYAPASTTWWKVLNRSYFAEGRAIGAE